MLTIAGVSKSYGGRTLFSDVDLQINRGDRIGLVGPNGAGKSTLFALILGNESPDDGEIIFERNVTTGHLPQESAPVGDETVLELATAVSPELARARRLLKNLDTDPHDELAEAGNLQARFEELGGHHLEARAKRILSGLSFRETDFDRLTREMSGGWIMRAHLARLLVQEPDVLILDEPTNHLDLESLQWFQSYLKGYPGAILMISHDREFLNQLVTQVAEIRLSRVFRYRGNYDDFLQQREANEASMLAAYNNQQREIGRLMVFVDRFRAKNTKATQAQSKLKQIERMEKVQAPVRDERKIHFKFPQPRRSGLKVVKLEDIHQAYGANVVYSGMDFEVERGRRVVLVGPNGAGKSTLLKILAGVLEFQSGVRELGYHVKAGYFSQHRIDVLNPGRTVLEEACDTPQRVSEEFIRTVLGSFLFRGDDVFKKVSVLSGGEKSRLALVKLLLDPPNLLLMDEPTTHLDMSSIDSLLDALKQYQGTLIFISHDVYFIRQIANHVVHVNAGRLTHYPGDYQYYLDKTAADSARAGLTAGDRPAPDNQSEASEGPSGLSRKEQKRLEAEERNARHRRRKEQQKVVDGLESQIAALEERRNALTAALEDPETYQKPGLAQQINRDLAEIQQSLEGLTADWELAASTLTQIE